MEMRLDGRKQTTAAVRSADIPSLITFNQIIPGRYPWQVILLHDHPKKEEKENIRKNTKGKKEKRKMRKEKEKERK